MGNFKTVHQDAHFKIFTSFSYLYKGKINAGGLIFFFRIDDTERRIENHQQEIFEIRLQRPYPSFQVLSSHVKGSMLASHDGASLQASGSLDVVEQLFLHLVLAGKAVPRDTLPGSLPQPH